jgi:hypothetical protein
LAIEYVIYADESVGRAAFYSNFYGGALVRSPDVQSVAQALRTVKSDLNLHSEVKWGKVTGNYVVKYQDLMSVFFNLMNEDRIKVRVMFTKNSLEPVGLSAYQWEHRYFLLYYQFIKHAFGLQHAVESDGLDSVRLRVYLDQLPDTKEKAAQFKGYLHGLERNPDFKRARVLIPQDQITEVRSHEHEVMQCLDIVIGAMQFRLNDLHKRKIPGTSRRGKRTIAKEKLYKHICREIRRLYPGFNVGVSTGIPRGPADRWRHPYRHWLFVPKQNRYDSANVKSRQK